MRKRAAVVLACAIIMCSVAARGAAVAGSKTSVGILNHWGLEYAAECVNMQDCFAGNQHRMRHGSEFAPDFHPCNPPQIHYGPDCPSAVAFSPGAVLSATAPQLLSMLNAEDTNVMYDDERDAIQVFGCNGNVVLHIPVASEVEDVLAG